MGGAVAIQVHRRQPQAWTGAVLAAPMCKIAEEMMPPKAVVTVLKCLAKVFPTWKLVPTRDITEVGFRDPEKRELVRQNPIGYVGKPRLSTALQLLLTTEEIGAHLHEVCLPLLVLHGAADCVTSPDLSAELVAQASSADKTLRLYQDAWHGLTCGEPDEVANQVISDIIEWMRARCPAQLPYNSIPLQYSSPYLMPSYLDKAMWQQPLPLVDSLDDDAQSSVTSS